MAFIIFFLKKLKKLELSPQNFHSGSFLSLHLEVVNQFSIWKLTLKIKTSCYFFRNKIQFKLLKNVCIQISPRKSSKTLRVAQTLFLRNAPVKYVGNQNSMKCTLTSADHFRETAALEKHHGQQTNTRCWILIKGFQQAPSQILNFKPAKKNIHEFEFDDPFFYLEIIFKGGNYMRKYGRYMCYPA